MTYQSKPFTIDVFIVPERINEDVPEWIQHLIDSRMVLPAKLKGYGWNILTKDGLSRHASPGECIVQHPQMGLTVMTLADVEANFNRVED